MSSQIDKSTLQYLGEEYQYKLVKEFMEDKSCFKDLAPIIDQNMFTGQYLRMYVGTMLEYLNKHGDTPSYSSILIELRQKAHTQADIEICEAIVDKIRKMPSDGSGQTRELATKFFKQQNIIKAANEMLRLAGNGDIENYDKCERLLKDALNSGNHEDYEESRLFDGIDETLSDDFRTTIPTGIGKIDESLNGGIGKGELGVILGPSSFGKVQPYDAKIATPNGFVEMCDISVGSKIIGADGRVHNVIGVYPHKDWDFYKVTFSDGTSTECGMEHLWNVNSYKQRTQKSDNSYKTMSLGDIVKAGLFCKNRSVHNFRIPVSNPVDFDEIPVKVDPYILGYMIGGGYFEDQQVEVSKNNIDAAIEQFSLIGYTIDLKKILNTHYSPSDSSYIHHDYLYNSLRNRIALLNGLMDSNGTCSKHGYAHYSTISLQLANDIRTLVLSLGGVARIHKKKSYNCKKHLDTHTICNELFDIQIILCDHNIPLFRLKKEQSKVRYKNGHYGDRYIHSVEYSKKCDGQCIKVDSDDELYLTDNFIVTHNTSLTTAMALHAAGFQSEQNGGQGFKVLQIVFEDRIKQIQRKHFSRITQVEACNLSKEEYSQYVRDILSNYEKKDVVQSNLRIIRIKSGEKSIDYIIDEIIKKHINNGFRPDLVIIDYFECIKLTGPSSLSKWDKETLIMRKIEAAANEFNIAFWVPVQGNKDSINTELVTMDNGGGSIGKIQVAHIIMSITRSLEDIAENIATISILKNRAGSAGIVIDGATFNNGTCTISTDNVEEFDSTVAFGKHMETKKDERSEDLTKQIFLSVKNKSS